ncbi:cytoplasmic tRNA 2-thiolation protein 2 [Trichonephila clavata]|uniref:Cytoplasmic tRNA 2-thiolation protein 2 n=1 Tax=Trichonephila clavata TaxID=2740835 RepID=A0A8X6J6A4_TRICU|nr:cytoplasmic tRNA 2-thiolation protein 2 [Trichonephila clavata]
MCSVEEDIEDISKYSGNLRSKTLKEYRNLHKCKKCDLKSLVLLQKKDPFCKKCFFEYCSHKFRSTIGKSKKIKHADKVLLACSGGRKSVALLHMTKETLAFATAKQISFIPEILFIDESVASPCIEENRNHTIHNIVKELKSHGFPVLYSSLEMVCKISDNQDFFWNCENFSSAEDFPACCDSQNCLKESMAGMSLSAKLDYMKHLRLLLTTEIASQAGFNHVFVGDTSCSLAENLLNNINLGRGSQISADTSFCDKRYKITVCRPLREFLNKEIAFYLHLNNCSYTVLPDLLTKTEAKSSIQRLTENFITNLQEDFPATVFTIFRTGGKLLKQDRVLITETCLLCKSKLDNIELDACSALEALKLSEQLSKNSIPVVAESEYILSKSNDGENLEISRFLCHGCSIPFRNNKKRFQFHPILKSVHIRMKRDEMKEEIKDFLINDDDEAS